MTGQKAERRIHDSDSHVLDEVHAFPIRRYSFTL